MVSGGWGTNPGILLEDLRQGGGVVEEILGSGCVLKKRWNQKIGMGLGRTKKTIRLKKKKHSYNKNQGNMSCL